MFRNLFQVYKKDAPVGEREILNVHRVEQLGNGITAYEFYIDEQWVMHPSDWYARVV